MMQQLDMMEQLTSLKNVGADKKKQLTGIKKDEAEQKKQLNSIKKLNVEKKKQLTSIKKYEAEKKKQLTSLKNVEAEKKFRTFLHVATLPVLDREKRILFAKSQYRALHVHVDKLKKECQTVYFQVEDIFDGPREKDRKICKRLYGDPEFRAIEIKYYHGASWKVEEQYTGANYKVIDKPLDKTLDKLYLKQTMIHYVSYINSPLHEFSYIEIPFRLKHKTGGRALDASFDADLPPQIRLTLDETRNSGDLGLDARRGQLEYIYHANRLWLSRLTDALELAKRRVKLSQKIETQIIELELQLATKLSMQEPS